VFDSTIGRWQSKDPKSFDAGDTNLYRFVGNHPSYATDPSGLEHPANPQSMKRFYLHTWATFPGYDSNAGNFRNSEQELGLDTVKNWMANDKRRAKEFFSAYVREWGDLVKQAAKANDIPAGVLMVAILSELVSFRTNDYYDIGDSRGPGQTSTATKSYYRLNEFAKERHPGTTMTRSQLFSDRMESLNHLGQLHLPRYNHRADKLFLIEDIWIKARLLSLQAREIHIAANGGGQLVVDGDHNIDVPAMSEDFLDGRFVKGFFSENPGGKSFVQNLERLTVMLISMGTHNPAATGSYDKNSSDPNRRLLYESRFDSFRRTQANFAYFMYENGYFKFVNQELVLNW
jgi:hypothetical protein